MRTQALTGGEFLSTPTANLATPFILDVCNKAGDRTRSDVKNPSITLQPQGMHGEQAKRVEFK
jgi:hypothetical protein